MNVHRILLGACAGAALALTLSACGPAAPAPAAPHPVATASDKPAESEPPLVYSKFTDPLYLAYSDEQNVFGRRTLARLWVAVASTDPPGNAQAARLAEASQALENTDRAVAAQPNACEAHVDVALERAIVTKNQLEQQYLQVTEQGDDQSLTAKRLDAQVHILRDEVEALRVLAEPCPKPMFDDPEGAI